MVAGHRLEITVPENREEKLEILGNLTIDFNVHWSYDTDLALVTFFGVCLI